MDNWESQFRCSTSSASKISKLAATSKVSDATRCIHKQWHARSVVRRARWRYCHVWCGDVGACCAAFIYENRRKHKVRTPPAVGGVRYLCAVLRICFAHFCRFPFRFCLCRFMDDFSTGLEIDAVRANRHQSHRCRFVIRESWCAPSEDACACQASPTIPERPQSSSTKFV